MVLPRIFRTLKSPGRVKAFTLMDGADMCICFLRIRFFLVFGSNPLKRSLSISLNLNL